MKINSNESTQIQQAGHASPAKSGKAEQKPRPEEENPLNKDPEDEYLHGSQEEENSKGLYRFGKDENGNPKIRYEDIKKSKSKEEPDSGNPSPTPLKPSPEDKEEACTANTDQVDREIEKLKEQKKQLEQQIRSAGEDPEKVKELNNKLAQINQELSQKDNDTYRRQHTSFSNAT